METTYLQVYFGKNMDSWQLITKNLDGGDTCSRHFTALYCMPHTAEEVANALKFLQKNNIPVRHPNTNCWYGRTNTTSRDQLIPYLCFTATPNKANHGLVRSSFLKLAAQHAKRLFLFAWNTKRNFRYPTLEEHLAKSTPDVPFDYSSKFPDICGPNIWAIYLRGFMHYSLPKVARLALYPVLCVLDMYELLSVVYLQLQKVIGKHIGPTSQPNTIDHDQQNATLCNHYSAHNYPTPVSWLSWKMHKPFGLKAADSFFAQPEEPRLDLAINMLD
jgi:hypothetical protein